MALKNKTDPEHAQRQLTTLLPHKLDSVESVTVSDVHIPSSSGLSSETVMFKVSWNDGSGEQTRELVARVEPTGRRLYEEYDLGAEFKVMQALGKHTHVPVPNVLFYEDDPEVLGSPFFVMDRIHGRVPSDDPPFTADGWVLELSDEEQAKLCDNGLQVLADIHRADHRALDLESIAREGEGELLQRELRYWEGVLERAEGSPNPTVEATLEWVKANLPGNDGPHVLNWGDARIGNCIFADDLSVIGVLDWEMVTIARPELDLGWWFFLLRHHSDGVGAPLPPGFPSREATVERYQEMTGHTVADLEFFEVFGGFRLAILIIRAANAMIDAGLLPEDSLMGLVNPATRVLPQLIDVPEPEGEAEYYIGSR